MPSANVADGRKIALVSVAASFALSVMNVGAGLAARSTSVVAAGLEFAGDVLASLIVFFGMLMASRPPDDDHPYGHGRFEILAGLLVGLILMLGGVGISARSLEKVGEVHSAPGSIAIWSLSLSVIVKSWLAWSKFRVGRRIGSAAVVADAWNDTVDILSSMAALGAVTLAIYDPARFLSADHYGGFAVGVIVVLTGIRVVRDASLELTDTAPAAGLLQEIRRQAMQVPKVEAVEKCYARKTGLQYHVDLHIEVAPEMTVAESHYIAHKVQDQVLRTVPSVAGVLVHIEPTPGGRIEAEGSD
jgi:cation diffusion facilitator family transporter